MIGDAAEGLIIDWNLQGKVKKITKPNSVIDYFYDAMGNRIGKANTANSQTTYTWYVRDAQGNPMATYEQKTVESEQELRLIKLPIYGSSRIGMLQPNKVLDNSASVNTTFSIGRKQYEISNHLGNVLTTISDAKQAISDGQGQVAYYKPIVKTQQDYYPFGMLMPERQYTLGTEEYRYGFNGQERTDEVYGRGNLNTALFWEYDTRLGRRWNMDPIIFPWQSFYATNNNNPVVFTDPLGLFGSRKEAKRYKKEHNLKGKIKENDDGVFSIDFKNNLGRRSVYRDQSLSGTVFNGVESSGVITSYEIYSDDNDGPSFSAFYDGIKEFATRGGIMLRKKDINKLAYESSKYLKQNYGLKIKPSSITNNIIKINKNITNIAKVTKRVPIIGHLINAKDVYDGIKADGNTFGANTVIELAGVAGGSFGALGLASSGALVGTVLIPIPGLGTLIGATAGAIIGSWLGEEASEAIARKVVGE